MTTSTDSRSLGAAAADAGKAGIGGGTQLSEIRHTLALTRFGVRDGLAFGPGELFALERTDVRGDEITIKRAYATNVIWLPVGEVGLREGAGS